MERMNLKFILSLLKRRTSFMKRFFLPVIILFFVCCLDEAVAQQDLLGPTLVARPVYFDVSIPLRDLVPLANGIIDQTWKDGVVKNHFDVRPHIRQASDSVGFRDPSIQDFQGMYQPTAPIQNFEGMANINGAVPPDTHGDVGPNHFFQVVNISYAIYNKTGTKLLGPLANSTVWSGMPNNSNSGDAVVVYDEHADRWLFTQFSLPNYPNGPFYQMIAVSQTPDPTGSWYRYQYSFADLPDYPKFGIWRDGYYMSTNRFTAGSFSFNGVSAIAFDRLAMLAGNPVAQMILFSLPNSDEAYSILPADCDGPFPSTGTPEYFMYKSENSTYHLGIYEFHPDWITPANSTFGNFLSLAVTTYSTSVTGIPQSGTTTQLDPITDRLLSRLQYRVFGDHTSMVCNHTVLGSTLAGIRWYELRNTGSGWSVYQQSTYSPDSKGRWMGSMAMDGNGNIALGYSVSSSTTYPSISYTGRLAGDALNTMTQAEAVIVTGGGSQTGIWSGRSRWGDYSSMTVDPTQCGTFWYTQEYYASTSTSGWQTRVASFQFPTGTLATDFFSDKTLVALSDTANFSDLTVGCPTSWAWSFSPSTITYAGGTTSSSRNPKVKFTSPGAYNVTLTASNGGTPNAKTKTAYINAGTPGLWTGLTSTNWNTLSNWHNYLVPGAATPVSIPSSAPNWPLFSSDLIIGGQCNSITLSGSSQLTISGNLTINPGHSLTVANAGLIQVGNSWNDYGIFNPGTGTVEFNTLTPGKITGGYAPNPTINDYSLTTFPVGMTLLSGATAGPTGDDASSVVNIGFTFAYMGVNYTQMRICTNGWVSLDQSGASTPENGYLFITTVPNTTLAPWSDDLMADGTSAISYKLSGTTPNRVFAVEWKDMLSYYTGATTRLNYQLKLYETTNSIEFQYGTVTAGTHNAGESASIGIEDATGGSGHFIDGYTGSRTMGLTNLLSNANWPVNNYRFSPNPLGAENFYNIIFNKGGVNFTIERNLVAGGEIRVKP
jgi:PKD repeat protein